SGAGRTSDGNGSHASTLKSPSYTKSVSWQHYPNIQLIKVRVPSCLFRHKLHRNIFVSFWQSCFHAYK
ncbi:MULTISPECIES: transposase, partial [unclassified Shigella]|uniref:transposase n=1 Tax=unclassified Shigella TaxID=2629414 RepID=UPI00099165C5